MTYDHDAVIVALASRASDQVKSGLKELHAGNLLAAEVFLNAAAASLNSLVVLLETPPPPKPMRKIALVRAPPRVDDVEDVGELSEWFTHTHGEPDDGAA